MTGPEVLAVRGALGLTQSQLGELVGCCFVTCSRWERGLSAPTPWQQAMLLAFKRACERDRTVAYYMRAAWGTEGVPQRLHRLLHAAYK